MSSLLASVVSRLAGWLAILHDKNFDVRHYPQTFQPGSFIPTFLLITIELYHFVPLSMTLTKAGVNKINGKKDLFASFSCTLSKKILLIRMKFDVVWNQFKLNISILLFNEI